jgi:PTH2 family peptidyl-tRNA hydrolase
MNTKQVIIIRKDLKSRRGKELAQAGHAVMKVFFDRSSVLTNADGTGTMSIPLTPAMLDWVGGLFTKIALSVNSEADLLEIYDQALAAGLPCSLIKDAGLTEYDGPTFTAVAIGPDLVEKIDLITRNNPKVSLY